MQTRSGNPRRRREAAAGTINILEKKLVAMETKEELTKVEIQSVLRMSKLLADVSNDFKSYHFSIVDQIEDDQEAADEQAILDEHDLKVMGLIDRFAELLQEKDSTRTDQATSQPTASNAAPLSTDSLSIDRHLDFLEASILAIRKIVDAPDPDSHVLTSCSEKIKSVEGEIQGMRGKIFSLAHIEGRMDKACGLEGELMQLRVAISRKTEESRKKEPVIETIGTPMNMGGVNLPRIEVPKFDGNILNWRIFWEQFDSAIHSKTQLTNSDKLTYLREALKSGPARNVIEGLTQTSESYEEAIRCLQERYNRPRVLHQTHVRKLQEAFPLKTGSGQEFRRLHDHMQQHIRALRVSGDFDLETYLTAAIELKLDEASKLKWTEYSNKHEKTPPVEEILRFLDLQARHHESVAHNARYVPRPKTTPRAAYTAGSDHSCVACKKESHPLNNCGVFLDMSRDDRWELIKNNGYCMNCLKVGHMANKCRASPACRKCRKTHHTLLHASISKPPEEHRKETVSSVTYVPPPNKRKQVLLMTCRAKIIGPDGSIIQARVFLDPGAACSFVTERVAQQLRLPRRKDSSLIAGIAGINAIRTRGAVSFTVSNVRETGKKIKVEHAFVLPRVTTDMPSSPVDSISQWKHLTGLDLADPEFGTPGRIDVLLGADHYGEILLRGRRLGPRGTPYALRTCFGWVLAGPLKSKNSPPAAYTCCTITEDDDVLRKFWEIEDYNTKQPVFSPEERTVVQHFESTYSRDDRGRFTVPLPRRMGVKPLGDSRIQAVERFVRLERSLKKKGTYQEFAKVLGEYFQMGHAEPVPVKELDKQCNEVYYFPMHAVRKEDSSTSKLRVVFDASAKSTSGTSLNDHLLVGPTVHASLVDVLVRFRQHRVAVTADVSRMYRAVRLPKNQRDLHRFLWREDSQEPIKDYRMTRLTFGVSASSFAANMALKQNAIDHKDSHPLAYQVVLNDFYVDDCLTGEDTVEGAIELVDELQELFSLGGFTLRKWKASKRQVLANISKDLIDPKATQEIKIQNDFAKVLGVEWNADSDCFRPMISLPKQETPLTKRTLVSNIARLFDVMGWCSPTIILMKMLLQELWAKNMSWDQPVPASIENAWERWRRELPELREHLIARPYFPRSVKKEKIQLHGFCDASEVAYAGVVYLRAIDSDDNVYVSLVMAKTKVAPIKRLSVPRLELCSGLVLSKLLTQVANTLAIPINKIYAWTDSRVVLGWLQGDSRRFKPFVGNRIAEILETIPSGCWHHVQGIDNPADCASRGIFPSRLANYEPWWHGPQWLGCAKENWKDASEEFPEHPIPSEEREIPRVALTAQILDLPLIDNISEYSRLRRVTGWILRFTSNCRAKEQERTKRPALTVRELEQAEQFWCRSAQESAFPGEISSLKKKNGKLRTTSKLLTLNPFLDNRGLLRVGGRIRLADLPYKRRHPIVLPRDHKFTKLVIRSEHERLLHAGTTAVSASLSRRFYIMSSRQTIRTTIRSCIKCRKVVARPKTQLLGQLPADRLKPGQIFDCVGVDYAGPMLIKSGPVRKPILKKAYVAVFVCFATKAVHLELVSDLTTAAFIATLRRFIGRRGLPTKIWSDHGTNFIGAEREIRKLLRGENSNEIINFCTSHKIEWTFTPEHAPHFGGLWEAAVKAFKVHIRKVLGEVRLNFEEFTTILVQVEACLNSRPLTPIPDASEALEVLTPGHFLIGKPLSALPDPEASTIKDCTLLKRWQLCQSLIRHLWTRWSKEYMETLWKISKWHTPSRNLQVGDIVCLREEPMAPTKWPLARIVKVHPGKDGKVRVATIETSKGRYRRPVVKMVPLVHREDED